jgi:hypothetical protein
VTQSRLPRSIQKNRMPANIRNVFGTDEEVAGRSDERAMSRGDIGDADQDGGPKTPFRFTAPKIGGGSINRAPLQHSGSGDRKRLGPGQP